MLRLQEFNELNQLENRLIVLATNKTNKYKTTIVQ